jgi:hypothetical protein
MGILYLEKTAIHNLFDDFVISKAMTAQQTPEACIRVVGHIVCSRDTYD